MTYSEIQLRVRKEIFFSDIDDSGGRTAISQLTQPVEQINTNNEKENHNTEGKAYIFIMEESVETHFNHEMISFALVKL